MKYMEAFGTLAIEEEINIGMIEKFLQELPEKAMRLGIRVVLAMVFFLIGAQLISMIRKIVKKSLQRGNVDKGAVRFIDSFIKMGFYVLLVILIGSSFGLDAASVVAVLGSAGVAIGLAIQGSLSNFVGGVLILLLKPFKLGDFIKEDTKGNEGTVSEIELFYTKLKTVDNKVIILPNGVLANTSLTNVTACESRRMDLFVVISYDADLYIAKEVLRKVLIEDSGVLKEKEHFIYVNELGTHGVQLGVRCWFLMDEYWEGKWRVTEHVKYALDKEKIVIPYPQVDVHLKQKNEI